MSAVERKECGSSLLLVILGILAVYGGARWLAILIPIALLLWYVPRARTSNATPIKMYKTRT